MRVAYAFKINPKKVGKIFTNRELRTAEAWLDEQMNVPSRTDHYLMSIAREVCLVLASRETRGRVSCGDFRLRFSRDDEKRQEPGGMSLDEYAKQLFVGMATGGKGFSTRTITRTQAREEAREIQVGVRS